MSITSKWLTLLFVLLAASAILNGYRGTTSTIWQTQQSHYAEAEG